MSNWLFTKEGLKEQAKPCHIPCSPSDYYKGGKCDLNGCYDEKLRHIPLELCFGFSKEDEGKTFTGDEIELVYQVIDIPKNSNDTYWWDAAKELYDKVQDNARRIIARRKEQEKPDDEWSSKKLLAERQSEIAKLNALWQYVQELNITIGLKPETLTEIKTVISSRLAQCEKTIQSITKPINQSE